MYSETTDKLVGLTEFPEGREGPSHDDLPDMLFDYLTRLSLGDRRKFSTAVERLYVLRVIADYRPVLTVNESVARQSVMMADQFFKAIEVAYG